jgi:hypothetical protein
MRLVLALGNLLAKVAPAFCDALKVRLITLPEILRPPLGALKRLILRLWRLVVNRCAFGFLLALLVIGESRRVE